MPAVPPEANTAVTSRNSIIGGSLQGGSCDWYITSDGGNVDGLGTQNVLPDGEGAALPATTRCFLYASPDSNITMPVGNDRRSADITLDAIADNGGPTLTHALQHGNVAIDNGVSPCPETDQRGVARMSLAAYDTVARAKHLPWATPAERVTVLHVLPNDQDRGAQVYAGQLRDQLGGWVHDAGCR